MIKIDIDLLHNESLMPHVKCNIESFVFFVHIHCTNCHVIEIIPISRTFQITLSSPIKAVYSLNQKEFIHVWFCSCVEITY